MSISFKILWMILNFKKGFLTKNLKNGLKINIDGFFKSDGCNV